MPPTAPRQEELDALGYSSQDLKGRGSSVTKNVPPLLNNLESVTNWSLQMNWLVRSAGGVRFCSGRQNNPPPPHTQGLLPLGRSGTPSQHGGDSVWSFWNAAGLPRAPDPGWSALFFELQGFQVLGVQCCSDFDLLILILNDRISKQRRG